MDGAAQKQLGLDLVENNNQVFVQTMRSKARMLARQNGSVTSDDLRAEALACDLEPEHPNAWGSIFRGPEWEPLSFEPSTLPSNRGRIIRRWGLKA